MAGIETFEMDCFGPHAQEWDIVEMEDEEVEDTVTCLSDGDCKTNICEVANDLPGSDEDETERMNSVVESLLFCNVIFEPVQVFEYLNVLSSGILRIVHPRTRVGCFTKDELATVLSISECCSTLLNSTDIGYRKFSFDDLHLYQFLQYLVKSLGGEFEDPICECEEFNAVKMIVGRLTNIEVRHSLFSVIVQNLISNLQVWTNLESEVDLEEIILKRVKKLLKRNSSKRNTSGYNTSAFHC